MKRGAKFVELDKREHDRHSFDCGEVELNTYIQTHAARHTEAGISRTYLLPSVERAKDGKYKICSFYTVVPNAIERETLPRQLAKKLPRYPVPVFLLAQLAIHKKCQGSGLGKISLINALERTWRINQEMAAYAVVVDCLNDAAIAFYERYGITFLCQHRGRTRLFISMNTVRQLFE